jgi:DNA polymerase III epsilon subunit-like protein
VYLHEYAHYLDFTLREKLEKGSIDPESRVAKAHKLLHSEDTKVALKTRRENPLWETDKYPMIATNYGTTNTNELVAEAMSGILAGNPQALDVMNEPLKEAIYDLLDIPEFDAPGGKKQRRMPWIENFTPEPLVPRGFASRGGTDTTIPAQTVSGTKQRRGYKKLKPRYFKTEDGEELELYHLDSTSNTFVVRRNGRGVARVSVIEDNNGLPKLTVMNIDPGYDAAQIESELTKYVKEYFPNARRPEGKTKTVRKVEVPGFASRGDNEVPLEKVDVTTPAGISALKEQLQRSKDDNKTATFMYNGELRRVDVKNIYEKDGISYVDGFDQVRGEGRTFRLDRVGQAKVVGTGRDTQIIAPPREPREPVAPYTGEAARLFEGATTYRQVYERLTKGELIFFDFETTGIEQDENGIMTSGGKPVQMGIIRVVDGKVVERKNMYMNPGQALGGWSKDNLKRFDENGVEVPLTDEWLQQQPTIAEAMAEALDFIGENKVMGGQYQIFDQRVMEEALKGTGLEGRWKPAGFIDSKGIIDHLYDKGDPDAPKSNRLGALTDHYGVELTNWHSADADAEASWGVIEAAIRRAAEREETNGSAPVKRTLLNTAKTSGEHDINHSTWQSQHNEWKSTMVDIARVKAESDKQPGFASRGTVEKPLDGRDLVARASKAAPVTNVNRKQAVLDALNEVRTRLTGDLREKFDEIVDKFDDHWHNKKFDDDIRNLVKIGVLTAQMAAKMHVGQRLGVPLIGKVSTTHVGLAEGFIDSGLEDALRLGGIEMMGFLLKDLVANQIIDKERAKEIYNNVKEAVAERAEAITKLGREMVGRMATAWESVSSRFRKRPKGFIPLDQLDPDFGGITLSDTGRVADIATKSLISGPQWAEIAVRDFTRHAPEQFTKSMNYTKPELRERIKNQVMAGSDGGKPGQWSARKAQLVAQKYRAAGGGYRGKPSKTQRSLKKWTKERWRTSDGGPAERPGGTRRYLPDAAWEKLTPGQRKATNRKKIEGSRSGRQFVPNTRNAAKAGRQARKG